MFRKFHRLLNSKVFAFASAVVIFLTIMAIGEVFLQTQVRDAENKIKLGIVSHAATLRARLEGELNALLYLNSGVASYLVVRNDQLDAKELTDILAVLYRSSHHVRNFGIAVGFRLTYVYPLADNEKAIGLNYQDQPTQWPTIQKIAATGTPALIGPLNLVQGGRGLIYRAPLLVNGRYWGLMSTVIDSDALFKSVFEEPDQREYEFALRNKEPDGLQNGKILGDMQLFDDETAFIQDIDVPGARWALVVKPLDGGYFRQLTIGVRLAIVLVGSLFAIMIFLLLRSRSELSHLVMYDSLTGLPNRRLLEDRAMMAFARQKRQPNQLCAMLFLDLDGFKRINDVYGHEAGDAVLQQAAHRAKTLLRVNDTVARWGGDEFIVLLENISQVHLDELAERLRAVVEQPFDFHGKLLQVGVSVGMAIYPRDGDNLDALLKASDNAMYQNKTDRKSGA